MQQSFFQTFLVGILQSAIDCVSCSYQQLMDTLKMEEDKLSMCETSVKLERPQGRKRFRHELNWARKTLDYSHHNFCKQNIQTNPRCLCMEKVGLTVPIFFNNHTHFCTKPRPFWRQHPSVFDCTLCTTMHAWLGEQLSLASPLLIFAPSHQSMCVSSNSLPKVRSVTIYSQAMNVEMQIQTKMMAGKTNLH